MVEDGTRVMLRVKALFRARGIKTPGTRVYYPRGRTQWLARLVDRGVRFRAALLLATMQTPWRFRTKRNLWAYAGLAVVTRSSADHTNVAGRPVRRKRAPMTRGLNRNHNRELKDVFKSAASDAAVRAGPLRDFYRALIARGMREELARVTLARKLAAITLHLWKQGEGFDPTKLMVQAR